MNRGVVAPAGDFPPIDFEAIMDRVTSGRHEVVSCSIAPPVAARVLEEFNVHNRNPTPRRIAAYAQDMRDGRWEARCGQPISFDVKSELDNGQDRLMACVEAGVSFPVMLVFGNADGAFDVIDRGRARTKGDTLTHHGEANGVVKATALALLIRWEKDRFAGSLHYLPTEREVLAALGRWPEMKEVSPLVSTVRSKTGCAPGPMAFCLCLCMRRDMGESRVFADKLIRGSNMDEDDPVLVLREELRDRLETKKASGSVWDQVSQSACIIKAWNAWRAGRKVTNLRFGDGERFPEAH